MIAVSGTGVGHAMSRHAPTLLGALTTKSEEGNITSSLQSSHLPSGLDGDGGVIGCVQASEGGGILCREWGSPGEKSYAWSCGKVVRL